jgi:hypothetical protein
MAEAAPARIPIVSPDGVPGTIDASELQGALANGYSQPPDPLQTTGNQVGALAEGVGQGLIPGFPSLEKAIAPGAAATAPARAAAFPGTATTGKVIGGGLQMAGVAAATGGLGALAEGAEAVPGVEAAADVAKGVDTAAAVEGAGATPGAASGAVDAAAAQGPGSAEEAAQGVAAAPGGQAAPGSPNLLQSGYTQQAIAGGVNSGSNYINESELGDHQFNGQALAQQVGIGGLMGLAGEGAINALRDTVAPPIISKANAALDALKKAGSKAFVKLVETANPDSAGLVEPALEATMSGAKPLTAEAAEQFADSVDKVSDAMDAIRQVHEGGDGYRSTEADKNLADISRRQVIGEPYSAPTLNPDALEGEAPARAGGVPLQKMGGGPMGEVGGTQVGGYEMAAREGKGGLPDMLLKAPNEIEPALTPGKLNPDAPGLFNVARKIGNSLDSMPGAGGALGEVKDAFSKWQRVLSDPSSTAAEIHAATLEMKQATGDSGIYRVLRNQFIEGTPAWDAAKAIEQRVFAPLKQAMLDESIWGTEQAGRNAALDVAARQKINAAKQVAKDFGAHELDLDSGKNELYLKAARIRGAFTGDPLANQEKLGHLNDYIDAAKNYLHEVQSSAGAAGAVAPGGKDLEALLDSVTAQRNKAAAYDPINRLLKASRSQPPLGIGAMGAGPVAGLVAHAAGAGLPGAAAIGAVVGAARAPVKAMQMFAQVSGAAATAKNLIGSSVRAILANNPARVAVTGAVVNALRGRTVRDSSGGGSNTFARQAKNISDLASNQEAQVQALAQNTSRLAGVAPNTTMAMHQTGIAALQELWAGLPKNPAPSPLASENKDWKPPPDQLSAWNALHSAILKPQTFLDACVDGTASPVVWQSLQRVYPQWTAEVASATMKHLTSHPDLALTTAQKLCTSMILGSPISPTVAPDQVAFQQSMYQAQAQGQAPAGGAPRHPTQHGMDKLDIGQRSALGGSRSKR